jgi:multicomponent Na+:H+ antiporter subunit D
MLAVPVVLLGLSLLLGCLPALATALAHGAGTFTDPAGYVSAVISRPGTAVPRTAVVGWTGSGVVLGVLSAGLACLLATTAARRRTPTRPTVSAVRALRRLHSGHLGDYLAWLALGVALLCAAIATQT